MTHFVFLAPRAMALLIVTVSWRSLRGGCRGDPPPRNHHLQERQPTRAHSRRGASLTGSHIARIVIADNLTRRSHAHCHCRRAWMGTGAHRFADELFTQAAMGILRQWCVSAAGWRVWLADSATGPWHCHWQRRGHERCHVRGGMRRALTASGYTMAPLALSSSSSCGSSGGSSSKMW